LRRKAGDKRGGRRAGAGRPRTINWKAVEKAFDAPGATEQTVIKALEIPDVVLENPEILARLRRCADVARAKYELQLRGAIRDRGLHTKRGAGSVNALALQARNLLDWDRQMPTQETQPDLTTARQRLSDLFGRLAEARSEIEGRKVTVEELLHRIAKGKLAKREGASC
jgi:hypothetical protein